MNETINREPGPGPLSRTPPLPPGTAPKLRVLPGHCTGTGQTAPCTNRPGPAPTRATARKASPMADDHEYTRALGSGERSERTRPTAAAAGRAATIRDRTDGAAPRLLRTSVLRLPGGDLVVRLAGEIDQGQRLALQTALLDAVAQHPRRLVVDLSGIGFSDSTGINALLRAREAARAEAVEFVVAGPGRQVRRLFAITGVDAVLTIRDSVEAALADGRDQAP